jgi:hypothetical protein
MLILWLLNSIFWVVIAIFIQVVDGGLIEVDVQHANLVPLTHPFVTCMP